MADTPQVVDRDEEKLAELGYKQELERVWSGFSNFAISFTIISVLAGTFTTFGQAWNAGGPWGAPVGIRRCTPFSILELARSYDVRRGLATNCGRRGMRSGGASAITTAKAPSR